MYCLTPLSGIFLVELSLYTMFRFSISSVLLYMLNINLSLVSLSIISFNVSSSRGVSPKVMLFLILILEVYKVNGSVYTLFSSHAITALLLALADKIALLLAIILEFKDSMLLLEPDKTEDNLPITELLLSFCIDVVLPPSDVTYAISSNCIFLIVFSSRLIILSNKDKKLPSNSVKLKTEPLVVASA